MIHRVPGVNPFEFVKVASLRAAQLMRGCTARVPEGRRPIITAQLEVAAGKVKAEHSLATLIVEAADRAAAAGAPSV